MAPGFKPFTRIFSFQYAINKIVEIELFPTTDKCYVIATTDILGRSEEMRRIAPCLGSSVDKEQILHQYPGH